jgi:hypothetical protein
MPGPSGSLRLGRAQGADRYYLLDRPVSGGDCIQLCTSGGWITGRFEWDAGRDAPPSFYFSVELEGGGDVAQLHFAIPEGALLRWP